jgi:hypothetical protein
MGGNTNREKILGYVREWTMAQQSVKACIAALDAADVRRVAPLGQHNREIATWLGHSAAQIAALVRDGVLYAEGYTRRSRQRRQSDKEA